MQCAIDVMPASVAYIKSAATSLWLRFFANRHSVPFAETSSGQCQVHSARTWLSQCFSLNCFFY